MSKKLKKLGLYIHIPFCRTICVYCAFPTFANKNTRINEYIQTLLNEIEKKGPAFDSHLVDTIYFGGGTPSLLSPENVEQILDTIQKAFPHVKAREICIECNPESLTVDKIIQYRRIGVTRLSIGIQSLNDQTLWKIARPHRQVQVLQLLKDLNRLGWLNFNCDLIIGLPYQTLESFKKDLQTVMRYKPAHLSTYFLSYDTPKIDTFIQDSTGEDEQISMYEYADKYLTGKGFIHYEVSNFALPGFECLHNLKYWNREEYLGLGLGAHSFIDNEVIGNQDDFEKYIDNPLSPKEQFNLEGDLAAADSIMLSLRKINGLDLKRYRQNFGQDATKSLINSSKPYIKSHHLTLKKNLFPTLKGWLILDKITRDLI